MHMYGMMGMLPADYWAHRRAAKRERLLSWRSLLDAAIKRLDETPAGARTTTTHGPIPPEFMSHRKAAHREDLMAFRSLIDAAIDKLKEQPAEQATRIDIA
jgi:hypothetical protein